MHACPSIAFFGSSLLSAYWNGAATYYRGIIRALDQLGYRVTFYEPDAYDRQTHRDLDPPDWAEACIYSATEAGVARALEASQSADIVVKASGVGVFDGLLEREVLARRAAHQTIIFWDVDAPATLERVREDSDDAFRPLIRRYDLILTYGGGPKVIDAYRALGAKDCIPIYNALDPTTHYPVSPDPAFQATLGFLGNRMPDRESRVDEFFFRVACMLPDHSLLLGGSGWGDKHPMPTNVRCVGHVYSRQHNSFNCSTCAVLNVNRDSMARFGYSPATRVFEAAGAGACLICDAWEGLDMFLEPDQEVLVARDGTDVAAHVQRLTPKLVSSIGQAARRRILSEHTYERRAEQLAKILGRRSTSRIATNRHQAYQT